MGEAWQSSGSRLHHGGRLQRSVVGAVAPIMGQLVSLVVAHCNKEVFQIFLDTVATEMPPEKGKTVHQVLDNSSWHKTAVLDWHHIKAAYLPPYSPDFNPIERLWQYLKGNTPRASLPPRAVSLRLRSSPRRGPSWSGRKPSARCAPPHASIGNDFWQSVYSSEKEDLGLSSDVRGKVFRTPSLVMRD